MAEGAWVKGTAVRTLLRALHDVYGHHAVSSVLAEVPSEMRAELSSTILASKHYPVAISAALQQAIYDVLGRSEVRPELANRRIGAAAARIDFGGVYSVFLRATDFETLLRGLERAWQQYNSHGELRWTRIDRADAEGAVAGTLGYNVPMWHSIAGRVEALLLLAGAKAAVMTIAAPDATGARFALRWRR